MTANFVDEIRPDRIDVESVVPQTSADVMAITGRILERGPVSGIDLSVLIFPWQSMTESNW